MSIYEQYNLFLAQSVAPMWLRQTETDYELPTEKKLIGYEYLIENQLITNHYEFLEKLRDYLPDLDKTEFNDNGKSFFDGGNSWDNTWFNLAIPDGMEKIEYLKFLYEVVDGLDVENSDNLRHYQNELKSVLSQLINPKDLISEEILKTERLIRDYRFNIDSLELKLAVLKNKAKGGENGE